MNHSLNRKHRLLFLLGVVALLGEDVGAQLVVRIDTIPMFGFAVNRAATAVGMRPLRELLLPPGDREVRVWTGFGLGMPSTLYRVRVSGGNIRGALILFWAHMDEWKPTGEGFDLDGVVVETRDSTGYRHAFSSNPRWPGPAMPGERHRFSMCCTRFARQRCGIPL